MELQTMTVGDLGTIYDGPHATPTRVGAGPYFLNIASLQSGRLVLEESDHVSEEDFKRWTKRVTPQADDLLFSYETRLGQAALMPPELSACLGRRMALLRPDKSIVDPRYLLYLYLSPGFQRTIATNTVHGATVPRIPLTTMGTWRVDLPSLAEQRAIAEVLGALDDKIVANERVGCASRSIISARYAAAVTGNGARQVPLMDAFKVEFGEAFKGDQFSSPGGEGRPLIRIRDLKTAAPQIWTTETREREIVVDPGDVLVGMDAEFRGSWWIGPPGLLNQRVLRASSPLYGRAIVREALVAPLRALEGAKSATTVIHLNKADLLQATVVVPSSAEAAKTRAEVDPLVDHLVSIEHESRTLASTRDALLPLLMSGKLRVRDAERQVEEVL